jgi:hypothetical protein
LNWLFLSFSGKSSRLLMRRRLASFALIAWLLAPLSGACNGQSEGQPCDKLGNGDNDCNNPCNSSTAAGCLTCTTSQISHQAMDTRCCPPAGQPATAPECVAGNTTVVDASTTIPDGSLTVGETGAAAAPAGDAEAGALPDAEAAAPTPGPPDAHGPDAPGPDVSVPDASGPDAADANGQ